MKIPQFERRNRGVFKGESRMSRRYVGLRMSRALSSIYSDMRSGRKRCRVIERNRVAYFAEREKMYR
jgi:hypothetical protein